MAGTDTKATKVPDHDEMGFLLALDPTGATAMTGIEMRRPADRAEDRIRTRCRNKGLAEWARAQGKLGWLLTERGIRAVKAHGERSAEA